MFAYPVYDLALNLKSGITAQTSIRLFDLRSLISVSKLAEDDLFGRVAMASYRLALCGYNHRSRTDKFWTHCFPNSKSAAAQRWFTNVDLNAHLPLFRRVAPGTGLGYLHQNWEVQLTRRTSEYHDIERLWNRVALWHHRGYRLNYEVVFALFCGVPRDDDDVSDEGISH